ncbi:S-layer homology domain-containing protein [Fictibacillus sp. BK138]|uniref:S-layer homology domain-containing protein n=1 Tax=Fictibacillus sp. BK138 TaxID=2512121 RepID=UPI001028F326|nr:S-layer homology domain-containing protein [Fictibacillus sp. BK138]RZT21548.1 beta-N-acetylglucosaminidase [Fictibacillus sp. BK138]
MKKFLYFFILPFVLLFGLGAQDVSASDGLENKYFKVPMRELIELGLLKGTDKNGVIDFEHDKSIPRAEFAALMVRVLGKENMTVTNPTDFTDVPKTYWGYTAIQQAAQLGIINGTGNGKFSPTANITREQIASIMNSVLEKQGITLPVKDLSTYKDANQVSSYAKLSMERIVGAGILAGSNNELKPKDNATRGMTSAFLVRMLDYAKPVYYVGTVTANEKKQGQQYGSYAEAKVAATGTNEVVLKYKKIVSMKDGQVTNSTLAPTVNLWNDTTFNHVIIGVASGTPVEFLESGRNWVKVKFGKKTGYVKIREAKLIPSVQVKGESFYEVREGLLRHFVYNAHTQKHESYLFGRSDADMPNGRYVSENGSLYKNNLTGTTYEAHQYFNKLPLYTKTSYTAEDLNKYVRENKPSTLGTSVLENMGAKFKEVEEEHNINAMYLLAHAIHESEWGTSKFSKENFNLFGIDAVDGTPGAAKFKSYNEGFEAIIKRLTNPNDGYFTKSPFRYHGAFLGNKDLGMNVFYAADPYWGQKIAGHMHRMDVALGGRERNKYNIAVTLTKGATTKVRSTSTVSDNLLYELTVTGSPVLVLDTVVTEKEGTWYEIVPKNLNGTDYKKAYVYSHGASYGTNMKLLDLAKE